MAAADHDNGGLSLGPYDGSPIPGPNMTEATVRYLLTQLSRDRVMRIDILRTASAVLLGFQVLLGSRRRRCGNRLFLLLLWGAYTLSYTVVAYTIGLIQSADAPDEARVNDLWVVQLLLLLGSADALSAFSRHDVEQSTGMQVQHVFQTLLVLWLLVSRDVLSPAWLLSVFDQPFDVETFVIVVVYQLIFFFFWVYSIVKMAQRMMAMRMASSSHGLVRSAKVVADYMHEIAEIELQEEHAAAAAAAHNGGLGPRYTVSDYKYLLYGEEKHSDLPSGTSAYRTKVHVGVEKAITIDMIFQHSGKFLSTGDESARAALKDTCLSFALFKLLKRRFCACELEIAEASLLKTRAFVLDVLPGHSGDDHERAFRVVDLELSFLYDFFYTKYTALFDGSRTFNVVRIVFLVGFFLSLILVIAADSFLLNPIILTKGTASTQIFSSFNNMLFLSIIVAVEVLQPLVAAYSNWAVVHFVCDHVRKKGKGWHCGIRQALIKWVAARRRARNLRYWNNKLGQHKPYDSFRHRPRFYNRMISLLTKSVMGPPKVELPEDVKKAVFRSLKRSGGSLTNGRTSVLRFQRARLLAGGSGRSSPTSADSDLLWACSVKTHTHTILVWHVATTICDEKMASSAGEKNRVVATSLSGYCAYLLAFVPEMLPDHSYEATQILNAVVKEARERDRAGKRESNEEEAEARDRDEKSMEKLELGEKDADGKGILDLGRRLGRQLMAIGDEESRWEMLAEFWAELVLFLAPSDNADVHAEHLARGGEFMTHLWALLTHAGVLSRPTTDEAAPAAATE